MKINRWLCLLCILCFLSCAKTEYSDIPLRPVNLTLYLGDKDKELNSVLAHKIYTKKNINASQMEAVGFGGVLVFHSSSGSNPFLAYDIACPYEINASITVQVDPSGMTATCPKCGSQYDLVYFGRPLSGPSAENPERKHLRAYNPIYSQSENKLYISNQNY